MEPIHAAIVGLGSVASRRAAVIGAVPEAKLLGVWDADAGRAATLAREQRVEAFPSLDRLLDVDDLDLVIVASARDQRVAHARTAIRAGRHVWLESPLPSAADLARLEADAKRAGVRVALELGARLHPRAAALGKAVAAERVGQVAMVRYCLRLPAPAERLPSEAVEALDLLSAVSGRVPMQVFAMAGKAPGAYLVAHVALDGNAIGTAEVHLAPTDARAFPLHEQLTVVGTKGTLRAGTALKDRLLHGQNDAEAGHSAALRAMARWIRGLGPPPIPPAAARTALAAWCAAEESARTGKPVTLDNGGKR